MNKLAIQMVAVSAITAFLSGCTHYAAFQATPSNAPLNPPSYKVVGRAQGKSCRTLLFYFIPLGTSTNRYQAAIDDALSKSGGDAIIEMTMDMSFTHGYPLFGRVCTHVNGLAVKRDR